MKATDGMHAALYIRCRCKEKIVIKHQARGEDKRIH